MTKVAEVSTSVPTGLPGTFPRRTSQIHGQTGKGKRMSTAPATPAVFVINRQPGEELVNALTHGIGFALSLYGLAGLGIFSAARGDSWLLLGCMIYGFSLVALYAASTLYHTFQEQKVKQALRTADQVCIYLLIAGTYTPFLLSYMRPGWRDLLIGLVWAFAIGGAIYRIAFANRFPHISALPYIAMGWIAIIAIKPIIESFPAGLLAWIVAGGFFYTFGVVFYVRDHVKYSHAIWHLFVMAGSLCHYCGVLYYVIPLAA